MSRPIVIGGGVAGLTAALHLAERGLPPLLLEADPEFIGGRLKNGPPVTLEHGGAVWSFPGEHGVHGIWAPYVNLMATLARHGITPALAPSLEETWVRGRGTRVQRAAIGSAIRNSPLPAPFHYLFMFLRPSFLNMLGLRDVLGLPMLTGDLFSALGVDPLAEQHPMGDMTLAEFTQHWPPNIRSLFIGLARNALSAHPAQVPASGFVVFLRFYTLMRRDAWGFSYLQGTGGSCISEPLAHVAKELGAELRLGVRAERLERDGTGWRVVCQTEGQSEESFAADQVILALDAPATEALLRGSPATAPAAAPLRFPTGVPTAIVRLWFSEQPRRGAASGILTGDFVADNFFWMHQFQPAYRAWSEATGGSAVEQHVYGPPELVAQPDAALLAMVVADVARAFPELRGKLIHSVLLRNAATHTLFGVGAPGEHLAVTTPWAGLYTCGDWVAHANPAMYLERATTTGIVAANEVLALQGREPWPILAPPGPEWLAARIQAGLMWVRRRRKRGDVVATENTESTEQSSEF